MAEGSTGGYAVFGDYVYYVSYQVDVYDEDVLVGSAVVTRRHGELADLVGEEFGEKAEPRYERLAEYMKSLRNNDFIYYKDREPEPKA